LADGVGTVGRSTRPARRDTVARGRLIACVAQWAYAVIDYPETVIQVNITSVTRAITRSTCIRMTAQRRYERPSKRTTRSVRPSVHSHANCRPSTTSRRRRLRDFRRRTTCTAKEYVDVQTNNRSDRLRNSGLDRLKSGWVLVNRSNTRFSI